MKEISSAFIDKTVDDVRNYWNNRPCNIRHSTKDVGSREYFDEVEARKYFVKPHIPQFADFARWKGKRVLEISCGIGADTMSFARAGASVTAVDLSDESLRVARRRAEAFGLQDRITFIRANAEQLSDFVPAETYDLVYSFGVIHHTPHPENVIREIRKYMGPHSELKIMVYNRYSWKVLWILLKHGKGAFWRLDELVAKYSEAQTRCPVTYSYSHVSIKNLLQGFDVKNIMVDHIFPCSIPEYKGHEYKKDVVFPMLSESAFRFLEKTAGWHLCAEAVPQKTPQ